MPLTSDWHIHSGNSCDEACLPVADLVRSAAEVGITAYGLTDHIHTPFNLPDLYASRAEFLAVDPGPDFHFGVEASCVSVWELEEIASGRQPGQTYGLRSGGPAGAPPALALTEQHCSDLGIEYVIGGTHWPLYVAVEAEAVTRDYHRQNMFLVTHPLVDIVAHPWWWMGAWREEDGGYRTDPWLDDFERIPASMHEEFAAAAVETGTRVEANLSATLLNNAYPAGFRRQYAEYLAGLRARGVQLSFGSDCHSARYEMHFAEAADLLAAVGLRDEDFWRLPPRTTPLVAPPA